MVDKNGTQDEPITDIEIPEGDKGQSDTGEGPDDGGASEKPTLSDLAEAGLSKGEIEIAKKQGLVKGESDGDKGDSGNGDTNKSSANKSADGPTKAEGESDGKKKEEKEERNRVLTKGKSPEQIISDIGEKGALTPDQEQVLMASLTQNGQAMYWAQKKERQKRQRLEAERTEDGAKKQKEIDDLKAQLAEARKPKKTEEDPLGIETEEPAEEVDPDKKPLTREDLDKIEAEKKAKADEDTKKFEERKREVNDALNTQQEEARERYGAEEFDGALGYVNEILTKANTGTLAELYPDPRQHSRVIRKAVDLLKAFAQADSFEAGDFNAADMTYELAKEHPKYKPATKKSNANGNKNGETGADGNPEDVDRALKNANRRGSSATLNGSGSRRVVLEELTHDQAVKVPLKTWNKLPAATRERLLQE
jgi:hypothetical protein